MRNSIVAYVGWLLLISALAFYAYGIYWAIDLSTGNGHATDAYPETLATTIGSIQALMLANLGIILGISISRPQSGVARNLMLNAPIRNAPPPPPMVLREKIQLIAVLLFILVLIACLITWISKGFTNDATKIVAVVPESGKMFIGVVLAYLTAVLSSSAQADENA